MNSKNMDYEKKYKDALKRAKAAIDVAADRDLVEGVAITIFPELRESEDESVRKMLISLVKHHSDVLEQAYEKDMLAWLEKQKENPKSANSIPLDCVPNAKCEDRWYKVTDSLPANPREVLCKDEAGNYFIGRYYVGEGWEISNYDDEDKPHHLNPPVSKWIDFPSEKQEESLRDFIDDFPYSDEQKEQKPADLPPGFYFIDLDGKKYYSKEFRFGDMKMKIVEDKSEKPAEWSEEDEDKRFQIIDILLADKYKVERQKNQQHYDELIAWLKSLRPFWKPSEEQMEAFKKYIEEFQARAEAAVGGWNNFDVMIRLFEQLKKLV